MSSRALFNEPPAGGEAAVRAMVLHHAPRLLAVARRLLDDESRARAAVAAVLGAARLSSAAPRDDEPQAAWLRARLVRTIAATLAPPAAFDAADACLRPLLPRFAADGSWAPHEAPSASGATPCVTVARALSLVPAPYRLLYLLGDVEGLSAADIAAASGRTKGEVSRRLDRVRRALRTLLFATHAGSSQARWMQSCDAGVEPWR